MIYIPVFITSTGIIYSFNKSIKHSQGCGNENTTLKIYDIKRNNNKFGYTMDKKYLEWLKKDGDIIVDKDLEVIILDEFIDKNKIKKFIY